MMGYQFRTLPSIVKNLILIKKAQHMMKTCSSTLSLVISLHSRPIRMLKLNQVKHLNARERKWYARLKIQLNTQQVHSRRGRTAVQQGSQPIHSYSGVKPDVAQYIHPIPPTSRVRSKIIQGVYGFPPYGHGTFGQGPPLFSLYAGVPFFHQNPQVAFDPQFT